MKTPWSDALEYATKNAEEAIRKEKMKMENIACFDILYPGIKAIANKMCWSCERGLTSYNFYRKAQTACGRDETRHLNEQEVYDMIREIGGHTKLKYTIIEFLEKKVEKKNRVLTLREVRDKMTNIFGCNLSDIPPDAKVTIEWEE